MKYNTMTKFKNIILASAIATLGVLFAATSIGSSAPSDTIPEFNALDGVVGGVGDESDFVRVRKTGTQDPFINSVDTACEDGDEVSIQVYIHNSSNNNANGANLDGPVVARDTRLSLTNGGDTVDGRISASNAASVMDSAIVTCNGQEVDFDFVSGSAVIKTAVQDYVALSDNVFTSAGTPIGYAGQDGTFPACYEYRAWVYAKVVIKKKEEPVVKKQCVLADPKRITRNKYEITANAVVQNTTVQSYTFTTKNASGAVVDTKVFNTTALSQTYNFEQATPGTYTVSAVIMTANGQAEGECVKTVKVEEEPKTPAYSCDMFTLSFVDRKANVSFKPVALNGATFKDASIKYNADGKTVETVTTNALNSEGKVVSSYTFASTAKNVEAVATVRFNVPEAGKVVVKDVLCRESKVLGVTTTPPTTLPKTGAGSVAGLMALVTVAGAIAHRQLTLKRNR